MRAALAATLLLSACAVTGTDDSTTEQDSGATQYVNIFDFAKTDQGAWYDLENKLAGEFNDVCGDTFCGGDFSNLTPLTFACSVTSKAGDVKDCAWSFAGSYAYTDPKTAVIGVDAPTFQCHVAPKTTSVKLIALLQNSPNALREVLPGTTGSIYDALVDCFQHPQNGTPFTPNTAAGTYVDADAYYTSATSLAKWEAVKTNLQTSFDHICGDTYCGSDYSDLRSLQFQCAVTKSSGNVKACDWIFGGSYANVGKTGAVSFDAKTWTCPVAVKGTMAQLVATLATSSDAIHATLPGETTSAYDAIGTNCLP